MYWNKGDEGWCMTTRDDGMDGEETIIFQFVNQRKIWLHTMARPLSPRPGAQLGHSLQAGHLTTSLVNIITSLIAVMLGHSLQGGHLTTDANVVANTEGDERSVRGANDKSTDHYAPIGSLMDGTNTMSRRTARTKSRDCHATAKSI